MSKKEQIFQRKLSEQQLTESLAAAIARTRRDRLWNLLRQTSDPASRSGASRGSDEQGNGESNRNARYRALARSRAAAVPRGDCGQPLHGIRFSAKARFNVAHSNGARGDDFTRCDRSFSRIRKSCLSCHLSDGDMFRGNQSTARRAKLRFKRLGVSTGMLLSTESVK